MYFSRKSRVLTGISTVAQSVGRGGFTLSPSFAAEIIFLSFVNSLPIYLYNAFKIASVNQASQYKHNQQLNFLKKEKEIMHIQ